MQLLEQQTDTEVTDISPVDDMMFDGAAIVSLLKL